MEFAAPWGREVVWTANLFIGWRYNVVVLLGLIDQKDCP